ncbi:MAG: stage V sporulation protein AA [Lachnospiraceae bacterium]|jgi:stage V sporulation protein AA|nr:stage V sporulation protein AA [Lachnospiraceae bacterium]
MGSQTIYINTEKNVLVHNKNVTLGDVAKIECTDVGMLRKLRQKKIYTFTGNSKKKNQLQVFSILKVIQLIHEDYPNVDVQNMGEAAFIIEFSPRMNPSMGISYLKTALLCIVIFFGSAFTIMAFNNDVGVSEVFQKFYTQVMGQKSSGFTELEIFYSIGLAFGILVFFNHVGRKKITHDPTPLQVEMRKYEEDIDTTFIENSSRGGDSIDVG